MIALWQMLNSENEVIANRVDFSKFENGGLKLITGFLES